MTKTKGGKKKIRQTEEVERNSQLLKRSVRISTDAAGASFLKLAGPGLTD